MPTAPGGTDSLAISMLIRFFSLEFPALNYSLWVNVTHTGDLDCVAFAASVVNTTTWPLVLYPDDDGSVVCNSNKSSKELKHN